MKICGQTLEEQISNAKKLGKSLEDYQNFLREEEIEDLEYAEWEKNMTEEEFFKGWSEDEIRHYKEKQREIQYVEDSEKLSFEDLF